MSLKDMLCDMDGCAGQGRMIVVCKDCWEQQQKHLEQQQTEIERQQGIVRALREEIETLEGELANEDE